MCDALTGRRSANWHFSGGRISYVSVIVRQLKEGMEEKGMEVTTMITVGGDQDSRWFQWNVLMKSFFPCCVFTRMGVPGVVYHSIIDSMKRTGFILGLPQC